MNPFVELSTGQKMPIIGYGMWQSKDPQELEDALEVALDAGYRHFDTAYAYQNEDAFGRVLQRWFASGKVTRSDLFIVTKVPPQGNHHERAASFLSQSLAKMQLDDVDLFLVHQPGSLEVDAEGKAPKKDEKGQCIPDLTTSLEKVWGAMEAQVDAGKAKAIGISNYSIAQVERIVRCSRIAPVTVQVELNARYPKKRLREYCAGKGIVVTAFAVFGSPGRLQYYATRNDAHLKVKIPARLDSPVVKEVGDKHGKSTGQVLLRYFAQQGVVVLAKSVTPERIRSNFQICDFTLDDEDMKKLDELDSGKEGSWAFDCKNGFPGIENHPEFDLSSDE